MAKQRGAGAVAVNLGGDALDHALRAANNTVGTWTYATDKAQVAFDHASVKLEEAKAQLAKAQAVQAQASAAVAARGG